MNIFGGRDVFRMRASERQRTHLRLGLRDESQSVRVHGHPQPTNDDTPFLPHHRFKAEMSVNLPLGDNTQMKSASFWDVMTSSSSLAFLRSTYSYFFGVPLPLLIQKSYVDAPLTLSYHPTPSFSQTLIAPLSLHFNCVPSLFPSCCVSIANAA